MVIIAGHVRYNAMVEMGVETVDVIVSPMSQKKANEFRIVDNKTSELAEWDIERLIPELRGMENVDELQMYFPDLQLDAMIKSMSGGESHEVATVTREEVARTETRLRTKFEEKSQQAQGEYVAVTCPECAHDFHVRRSDIVKVRGSA